MTDDRGTRTFSTSGSHSEWACRLSKPPKGCLDESVHVSIVSHGSSIEERTLS
jgi:hypothetical protein